MLRGHTQDRLIGWCRQALRFVLPVECLTCGASLSTDPVPFFCTACWHTIRPLQQPVCARCDQPFVSPAATAYTPNHQCQDCIERPPDFERAWTLFPYLPPLQDAICSFKYRGKHTLARPLARLMISALPQGIDADVIIPVPLHPARLRARDLTNRCCWPISSADTWPAPFQPHTWSGPPPPILRPPYPDRHGYEI